MGHSTVLLGKPLTQQQGSSTQRGQQHQRQQCTLHRPPAPPSPWAQGHCRATKSLGYHCINRARAAVPEHWLVIIKQQYDRRLLEARPETWRGLPGSPPPQQQADPRQHKLTPRQLTPAKLNNHDSHKARLAQARRTEPQPTTGTGPQQSQQPPYAPTIGPPQQTFYSRPTTTTRAWPATTHHSLPSPTRRSKPNKQLRPHRANHTMGMSRL